MKPSALAPSILLLATLLAVEAPGLAADQQPDAGELQRWHQHAANTEIIRDRWGIPHVYGKTDADAVFGMIYAQAEDDFNRVEMNYVHALGRLAEVEGRDGLPWDLRMRLFIDPVDLKRRYRDAAPWLKRLMDAFADGLNYYLHTHPAVEPRLLTRFEPWMALAFSEGSIGGDIERVSLDDLTAFYGLGPAESDPAETGPSGDGDWLPEASGSNGFAVAPARTSSGNALFLINPHTSFFFRAELHMVSGEGLDAYGATTWGQFFVYQGFNDRLGWMHTSSRADTIDEYLESVFDRDGGKYYRHGTELLPLRTTRLSLPYRSAEGEGVEHFTVYHSHHGPVIREQDGRWVSVSLMQRPADAIAQSFLRTKARNHGAFRRTMEIRTNSSNNTVYADADGNIALYFGNFMPRRDPRFDWSKPVDGADPATDWRGLHDVDETIVVLNPPNGWIQNTNNWPFSAAGKHSPRPDDYPAYMAPDVENMRGVSAVRVLSENDAFTLESFLAAAYDPRLTAFEKLLPVLFDDWRALDASDPLRASLRPHIETLQDWDFRWSVDSEATSLAVFWGEALAEALKDDPGVDRYSLIDAMADATRGPHRVEALDAATKRLIDDFGSDRVPWGDINRYQRNDGSITQTFDDDKPSLPVGFTSSLWGSLAAFHARTYPGTRRMYGTAGNSFVAAVEFGDRVRALAITAGGQSGDPASPHFSDQAQHYADGQLRGVWFYREEVERNAERRYHPGE